MFFFRRSKKLPLDYDKMILLDAEELAEGGVKEAYDSLKDVLRQYAPSLYDVQELYDDQEPSYRVQCAGQEYVIYSSQLSSEDGQSWGRATYALFQIVNNQLQQSGHRFYAINGGNELGGMFLTEPEVETARSAIQKIDWPYLPTIDHPWFGQHH